VGDSVVSVCTAYEFSNGELGPASAVAAVRVAQAGVTVFGLPATWPAGVVALQVYATEPGGMTPRRAERLTSPASSTTVYMPYGERCLTLDLAPMPPGEIVTELNGRLYCASGTTLFVSEPYMHGLYNPVRGYIPFPEAITMVVPCQNGVFISADQTYWLAGDPLGDKAELNPVLPYKAVRGTSGPVPNANACFWFSERGIVIGQQDGSVENIQEANVATGGGALGASLFREDQGTKRIIAAVSSPSDTAMNIGSWMDAEVIRKETDL